jgi:endonuclease/exonuclease/phosphatase family metal-dependent hydrolase
VLVPAVAVCLLLVGAGVAVRAAHQPARAASGEATSGASPRATQTTAPSASASPSASAPVSTSPSPTSSFDTSVAARDAELRRLAKRAQALTKKRREARPVARFTMASFNTQGAVHTRHNGRASGTTRTVWMRDLLLAHGVDLVALQEFERVQVSTFLRVAGATYDVYPGLAGRAGDAENAVAWRRDTFALVTAETRPYHYFNGAIRNMPRVLLRHRGTGAEFWVTSYHNPASIRKFPHQQGWRAKDVGMQITDANALLASSKAPLIVAGDMNDRATYFCRMAAGAPLHSADGSTYSRGCHLAPRPWIDWILGSKDVAFSGYQRDRSGFVRKTSDHPIVVTEVKVTGRPGAGKNADRPAAGG